MSDDRYGAREGFPLGVEEELITVDPRTLALAHTGVELLERAGTAPAGEGTLKPDTYAAMAELASPVVDGAAEGVRALAALRRRLRDAGGTLVGVGIHPDGAWGDVVHHPAERYREIHRQLRGLLVRTPTAALHVHVGMPDRATAVAAHNGLRRWLPLLQALAANSPWWHGRDSGLASARAQLFRGYPRADIPRAWEDFEDFERETAAVVEAGDAPDYTFLWQDIRLHPKLGTVEVRAMDAQSALWAVAGLAALVHGLAIHEASSDRASWPARAPLMESSFRAARDGLAATLHHDGALRPVPEVARDALAIARAHLADPGPLEEVERLLGDGGGADRQRAAFAAGGMPALLRLLADETAADGAQS
ncbi:YbdK family carboxylate-amine ligase [Conexibacter sp. SYSU D00693]|uniref:carboxylate-amine ligase n=1 Tax=Conexibacter sp. SYSU D00693 TaxID=2812560 RepID=UPI00196AEA2C|nr:YbdK family carboxylate-amine ligase [Conexibacter sp. SYSU D00693]